MGKPCIRRFMTVSPVSIGREQTLATAHRLMREHRIRHLPVLEGGLLVGIVSDRDLHLVETLRDADPAEVTVDEAMSPDPYAIGPDAPLEEVARHMADHKLGSAVIVEGDEVLGVFTTVDALRALSGLLHERRRPARGASSGRHA